MYHNVAQSDVLEHLYKQQKNVKSISPKVSRVKRWKDAVNSDPLYGYNKKIHRILVCVVHHQDCVHLYLLICKNLEPSLYR